MPIRSQGFGLMVKKEKLISRKFRKEDIDPANVFDLQLKSEP
jgi:hypothetical protein